MSQLESNMITDDQELRLAVTAVPATDAAIDFNSTCLKEIMEIELNVESTEMQRTHTEAAEVPITNTKNEDDSESDFKITIVPMIDKRRKFDSSSNLFDDITFMPSMKRRRSSAGRSRRSLAMFSEQLQSDICEKRTLKEQLASMQPNLPHTTHLSICLAMCINQTAQKFQSTLNPQVAQCFLDTIVINAESIGSQIAYHMANQPLFIVPPSPPTATEAALTEEAEMIIKIKQNIDAYRAYTNKLMNQAKQWDKLKSDALSERRALIKKVKAIRSEKIENDPESEIKAAASMQKLEKLLGPSPDYRQYLKDVKCFLENRVLVLCKVNQCNQIFQFLTVAAKAKASKSFSLIQHLREVETYHDSLTLTKQFLALMFDGQEKND